MKASKKGDFAKAEEIFKGAQKLSPESPLVNYAMGKFYFATKKEEKKGAEKETK